MNLKVYYRNPDKKKSSVVESSPELGSAGNLFRNHCSVSDLVCRHDGNYSVYMSRFKDEVSVRPLHPDYHKIIPGGLVFSSEGKDGTHARLSVDLRREVVCINDQQYSLYGSAHFER